MRSSTIDKEIKTEKEELKRSRRERKNEKKENGKKYTTGQKVKIVFTHLFRLGIVGIIAVLVLLYGPYNGFRDWLITTAMTTMTHQYFATWFYDDDVINSVLDKNKVVETDETTDTSLIKTNSHSSSKNYENEYEKQILERDSKNNDYKIINITGKGYSGYLVAVYDPSRIKTVVTAKLGHSGQYLTTMAENNNALLAINGGGFNDPNFNSTGGSPLGITVTNGKYVTTDSYKGSGGLMGFTEDDKFVLGKMTVTEAKKMKIRDAVTFGPFLIVNGKSSEVLGNGGWGTAPRTAIGQRKDGIVLFLIIDGRTTASVGADMVDLTEIMQRYKAYNAANMDGGSSTALIVKNQIYNKPVAAGKNGLRAIPNAWIVVE